MLYYQTMRVFPKEIVVELLRVREAYEKSTDPSERTKLAGMAMAYRKRLQDRHKYPVV